MGAALAFYMLLSMAPMVILAVAMGASSWVKARLERSPDSLRTMGPTAAETVTRGPTSSDAGGVASVIGSSSSR